MTKASRTKTTQRGRDAFKHDRRVTFVCAFCAYAEQRRYCIEQPSHAARQDAIRFGFNNVNYGSLFRFPAFRKKRPVPFLPTTNITPQTLSEPDCESPRRLREAPDTSCVRAVHIRYRMHEGIRFQCAVIAVPRAVENDAQRFVGDFVIGHACRGMGVMVLYEGHPRSG